MVLRIVVLLAFGLPLPAAAERLGAYDYPFVDPLVATVVGTPTANAADLPSLTPGRNVRLLRMAGLVDRPTPPVFFYERHGLGYLLAEQPGPAPLVVVIGGTGAGPASSTSVALMRILHGAGFHVITLPNPTQINFLVNASTTGVPGRIPEDAADLYRAIQAVIAAASSRITITGTSLAGFSLGGTYAAFVAELDSREHAVGFQHVLMINPAVSVIDSVRVVDRMLTVHEEADPDGIRRFIEGVVAAFGELQANADTQVEFAGDFIYRTYAGLQLGAGDMEKLVGLAFRLLSANLVFVADVVSESHVVVPAGTKLGTTTSLTPFWLQARKFGFEDYFERIVLPFHLKRDPGLTEARLIEEGDLHSIEGFLRKTPTIGVLTSEDDFILRAEDLSFIDRVFADRAAIYPTGGHGGNVIQRDVVARIQAFFRGAQDPA